MPVKKDFKAPRCHMPFKKDLKRTLRKGFTTGASAAAGAKAAAGALFAGRISVKKVSLSLPTGASIDIPVKGIRLNGDTAAATIVKQAGDDPDVTNGAEIVTEVALLGMNKKSMCIRIRGGAGVGMVTRPGLKVGVGFHAINPVPKAMIKNAIKEAAIEAGVKPSVMVTVSVPDGACIAKNTMNERLGIIGGISILGTTGIVEPLSLRAYRDSIDCALDVAVAGGIDEVVFSTGRSSEKVMEQEKRLKPEAFIIVGDHMGYALKKAGEKTGIKKITIAAQFGKLTKLATGKFETHCLDASVELSFIAEILKKNMAGDKIFNEVMAANTARQVFFMLKEKAPYKRVLKEMCALARDNARAKAGRRIRVSCALIGYENEIAVMA